jgi:hypothetical protein
VAGRRVSVAANAARHEGSSIVIPHIEGGIPTRNAIAPHDPELETAPFLYSDIQVTPITFPLRLLSVFRHVKSLSRGGNIFVMKSRNAALPRISGNCP